MTSLGTSASGNSAKLSHEYAPGLDLTVWSGQSVRELHLTVRPLPGEPPGDTWGRLACVLRTHAAAVVRQEIFGRLQARAQVLDALSRQMGPLTWPVTYIEGAPCTGQDWAGTHLVAVAQAQVQSIQWAGRVVGRAYEDGWARHILLGDLLPQNLQAPKPDQALECFRHVVQRLQATNSQPRDLVRTWLFLDDIVSWYDAFNRVRTAFYQDCGVTDRLPASTGIGGRNAAGAAVCAVVWAAQPRAGAFSVRAVPSPRQCDATCYGSAFSRAIELRTPELSRLLISGTASIDPAGRTAHVGNAMAQIELTMEVVAAILKACGADFADASRLTAYFKRPEDCRWFELWRAKAGLEHWPVLCLVADVCRDELLFEVELDVLRLVKSG